MKHLKFADSAMWLAAVFAVCMVFAPFAPAMPAKAYGDQGPYYYLPFAYGATHTVTQGNDQCCLPDRSHYGLAKFAWDFGGDAWAVYTSRAGYVVGIEDRYGSTPLSDCHSDAYANTANYLMVRSGPPGQQFDALYMHLAQGWNTNRNIAQYQLLEVGMPVATADTSGQACGPHLHFQVQQMCATWYCQSVAAGFVDTTPTVPYTGQIVTARGGPFGGYFRLRNSNTTGGPDTYFQFGQGGDFPIVGDWTGAGPTTVGLVRGNHWYLRPDYLSGTVPIEFDYGLNTDVKLVGDWTGQCKKTPGLFRNGVWYLRNSNTTGIADFSVAFGLATDIPIVGAWTGLMNWTTGCAIETPGIVRGNHWILRPDYSSSPTPIEFDFTGQVPTDIAIVGNWTGQCNPNTFGKIDTPGLVRGDQRLLRNSNTTGGSDITFTYTGALLTDVPLVGHWNNQVSLYCYARIDTPGLGRQP